MNRYRSSIAGALALLCGITAAAVLVGFWMGYRARKTADKMKALEWINNDRGLEKIRGLPNPREGFSFAIFGDIQIGTAQLPRLVQVLEEEKPTAFIVQTGDAVSHAEPGHYNVFLSALARSGLRLPMFVMPGNHDVAGDDDDLFGQYFGPRRLWFEYGGALFILLDNSLAPFTDEQRDWLENVLEEQGAEDRLVFLFMHHQPIHWDGDGKRPVEHAYVRFFELLKDYKVDYVFSGNWHGYHREERGGTVFIVNGRGGSGSRMVPCYFTIVDVYKGFARDRVVVLPPRAGILARSLLDDWLIAHIGEFAVTNRWLTFGVMFLAGTGCIYLLVRAIRGNRRAGAGDGAGG